MDFGITAAMQIATTAHSGQIRKYTGEPYIVHPFAVAGLVMSVGASDTMIMAAFLHDVVEDTAISIELVAGIFGESVAELVAALTNDAEGSRALRHKIERIQIASASPAAKTLRLADIHDNLKDISLFDPSFGQTYMLEKRDLLTVLHAGNQQLYRLVENQINTYFQTRGNKNEE